MFPGSSLAVFRGFACDADFDFDENYKDDTARAACGPRPLPPRKPGDCAGVSRAPPPPKPATFNDDDEHVVKYAAPAPAAYGFKSVNGTGETGAVESNDVDEDEWN